MKISLISQKQTCFIFLSLLSLWIVRDFFRPDFFQSHDALYHVVRLDQFHKALSSGQLPVRWAPDLLNGLGYPLFVVNYHLPYYLAEVFHLLGLSLFAAIKAVLILSLVASALTSFWLFYSWTQKSLAATTGAIFYILAPYRLANIFERGAVGEAVAYVFIPLVFLGLDRLKRHRSIGLLSFALTGLTLSHTVVAITFAPVFLGYLFISGYTKHELLLLAKAGLLTFGLSAFQLFPAIFERHYLQFDANLLTAYQGHFKNLYQLLRLPHPGVNIGTRFQVGLTHLLVLFIALTRKKLWPWIGISVLAVFLVTPASQFLWDNLPVLPMVLYPWRFLGIVAFTTAALAALLRPKFFVSCILFLMILYTNRHYIKVDQFIPPVFPQQLLAGNGTTQNEFDPIWFTPETLAQPRDEFTKLYFPGWPGSPDAHGLVSGKDLEFNETPVRQAGNWLSVFSLLLWLLSPAL